MDGLLATGHPSLRRHHPVTKVSTASEPVAVGIRSEDEHAL